MANERPILRVVKGDAAPEDIAALLAVLAARAAARPGEPPRRVSAWADRTRSMRTPLAHGPGAWRWSAFPR